MQMQSSPNTHLFNTTSYQNPFHSPMMMQSQTFLPLPLWMSLLPGTMARKQSLPCLLSPASHGQLSLGKIICMPPKLQWIMISHPSLSGIPACSSQSLAHWITLLLAFLQPRHQLHLNTMVVPLTVTSLMLVSLVS